LTTLLAALAGILLLLTTATFTFSAAALLLAALPGLLVLLVIAAALAWLALVWICHIDTPTLLLGLFPNDKECRVRRVPTEESDRPNASSQVEIHSFSGKDHNLCDLVHAPLGPPFRGPRPDHRFR
jgi:hypothetical protein